MGVREAGVIPGFICDVVKGRSCARITAINNGVIPGH